MRPDPAGLMTPRILVVDDERQIHAALRLRLGPAYDLVFCLGAAEALGKIGAERFDLCFTDIHMPQMDGLAFIEAAQALDPCLGFVVLSAFDSHANLRRTIPLHAYDFVSKPLPERDEFEARVPGWIDRTRRRRRDHHLAGQASAIAADRDVARLERDVELVASETARDALLQTACFLTTIHAHLVTAGSMLAARARSDSGLAHIIRNLDEGRRTADAAMTSAESFFDSSYGSRDASPAVLNEVMRHAISIASRRGGAELTNKSIDFVPMPGRQEIRGLSGIEFLMTMVPAVGAAITSAPPQSTIGIRCESFPRLESVSRSPSTRGFCWLNRRNALASQPAVAIMISANAEPLKRPEFELWLKGEYAPFESITLRGLIAGIEKSQGLLGFSTAPDSAQFRLILALPV